MKKCLLAVILLANVLLSGCAYFGSLGADVPEKIDRLIAEQQYGQALDILEYIKPGNPNYIRLMQQKKTLLALASKLEKKTIDDARQFVRKNEWYRAQQAYEQALDKLPDSKVLTRHQQAFLNRRNKHLNRLELKLVLNKARWLIANTPVQQEIIRVLPDAEKRYAELKDYRIQKEKTAQRLLEFTFQALDRKDYSGASNMLNLISKLAVETLDRKQLSDARQRLKKVRRQRQIQQEKKTRELIAALKQGYSHEGLRQARQQLDFINSNRKLYQSSRAMYQELEQLYRKGIEQRIRAGRDLYSQGKIEEALKIWQSLQEIDKHNQKLKEHIKRANRVLNKLERLEKDAQVVKPPLKSD